MYKTLLTRKAIFSYLNERVNPDQKGGTWPEFQILSDNDQPPTLSSYQFWSRGHNHTRKVILVGQNWLLAKIAEELALLVEP